jgi:FkbM family methyltransferase
MHSLIKSSRALCRDIYRWRQACADMRSWARISYDVISAKLGVRTRNQRQSIKLSDGRKAHYRVNKGDLWSMREVLLDQCYRFPGSIHPETVVDLGGNIGLTSLWMDREYVLRKLVIVEPHPANAFVARLNLEKANAEVTMMEAAVGSSDGTARFSASEHSNLGFVEYGSVGDTRVISMDTLFNEAGIERIDLLKVDIEGGEADLFSKNLGWLASVGCIIAELHPDLINAREVRENICSKGFRHITPGSVFPGNMEAFVRA